MLFIIATVWHQQKQKQKKNIQQPKNVQVSELNSTFFFFLSSKAKLALTRTVTII
jgi:hypothetical protein